MFDNINPIQLVKLLKTNNLLNNNNLHGGNQSLLFNSNLLINPNINSSISVSDKDLDDSIVFIGNEIYKLEKIIIDLEKKINNCNKKEEKLTFEIKKTSEINDNSEYIVFEKYFNDSEYQVFGKMNNKIVLICAIYPRYEENLFELKAEAKNLSSSKYIKIINDGFTDDKEIEYNIYTDDINEHAKKIMTMKKLTINNYIKILFYNKLKMNNKKLLYHLIKFLKIHIKDNKELNLYAEPKQYIKLHNYININETEKIEKLNNDYDILIDNFINNNFNETTQYFTSRVRGDVLPHGMGYVPIITGHIIFTPLLKLTWD